MKRAGIALVAVASLVMSACGQASEAPAAAPGEASAPAAPATAEAEAGVPAGLPAYLAPMAGGKIAQSTSHEGMQTMEYTVDKPLADVVAFHRDAIKAAGRTPATDMGTSDGHSITLSETPSVSITFTGVGASETKVSVMSSE